MVEMRQSLAAAAAGVLLAVIAVCGGGKPAFAADFPTVVRAILNSQTEGRLAQMGTNQRTAMTNCVIATLNGLPSGKKRLIVEGANLDEQEHRFGQVVMENHAEWKQKIARACASIAMGPSSND